MPSDQWVVLIHAPCLAESEREMWGHSPVVFFAGEGGVGSGPVYISVLYHLFALCKSLSAPPTHAAYFLYFIESRQLKSFNMRESIDTKTHSKILAESRLELLVQGSSETPPWRRLCLSLFPQWEAPGGRGQGEIIHIAVPKSPFLAALGRSPPCHWLYLGTMSSRHSSNLSWGPSIFGLYGLFVGALRPLQGLALAQPSRGEGWLCGIGMAVVLGEEAASVEI